MLCSCGAGDCLGGPRGCACPVSLRSLQVTGLGDSKGFMCLLQGGNQNLVTLKQEVTSVACWERNLSTAPC